LIIISDEGEGPMDPSSAVANERPGPNEALPGGNGPGGGDVGAVLVSPFITPGGFDDTQYNHYSLLASIFNIFQLNKFGQHQLGYAAAPGLPVFGSMSSRIRLARSARSA
jgi:phosphatidylinositol-3-phosphatase